MNSACNVKIDPAVRAPRRYLNLVRSALYAAAAAMLLLGSNLAEAASLKQGVAAFNSQNYMLAAHILTPASTPRRVVNMTAIAAVEAQIRKAR